MATSRSIVWALTSSYRAEKSDDAMSATWDRILTEHVEEIRRLKTLLDCV
jgi:hypothetical protein